ncbi:dihydrofolate reductase [uncultured Massilia sp.]|uniref:dihydrofolate reductase n=1 Tax=uncultured Massilia sp. TaxID=169973 RepID=UPI002600EAC6|nr:dihydrofolate reductase [uncultured Massilia sp.]
MTQHLTLVVAMDAQRGIGIDNKLPWHLPEDLAHFKRVTLGRPIIMGRKTFDSIGRALPGRRNIVVTRNPDWRHDGVEVAASLEDAVALARADGGGASIIGGAQIFAQALDLADRMVITHIDKTYACDTFFPEIDTARWTAVASAPQRSQAEDVAFSFVTYDRVK